MNIHEYQAKQILLEEGVPVPSFVVASSIKEVKEAIEELKVSEAIIKIQVHAGGRGKAGGVKFAKNRQEILDLSQQLLGMKMVNQQTGPSGIVSKKILISKPLKILREFYIGVTIDREKALPLLIASPQGGMDIEEVAARYPDQILKVPISIDGKIHKFHYLYLAKFMKWDSELQKEGTKIIATLAHMFIKNDASLLEINPLVEADDHHLWALDAKLSIDDNALYRHPNLAALYDPSQYSINEVKARASDLSYIELEGNIGCMVNGAGLAMATMDLIRNAGGSPANFLDVGGSASAKKISEGLSILISEPRVKVVFVNIFGGIMSCETIAEGILDAFKSQSISIPIIVRMEGSGVTEGKKMLKDSKLRIQTEDSLEKAALLAVKETYAHSD